MKFKIFFQNVTAKAFRDATYDWYGALIVLVAASVIMFFVNGFFFFKFTTLPEQTAENGGVQTFSLDQADVTTAVKNISEREVRSKSVPSVVRIDPSL